MKVIKVIIGCCEYCPYYNMWESVCDKEDKFIEDEQTIPDWCPLEEGE